MRIVVGMLMGCLLGMSGSELALAQKSKGVATLLKELKSKDASVRTNAARALGNSSMTQAEKKSVTSALGKALADSHGPFRMEAATSLGKLRTEPKTVVPALKAMLTDEETNVQRAAATALGEFGKDAKEAVSGLQELEKSTDRRVARAAQEALVKIRGK